MARGTIHIDAERCKGCMLCPPVCPKQIIVIDEASLNAKGYHPARLDDPEENCTGCAICAVICPEAAIIVYREVQRNPKSA